MCPRAIRERGWGPVGHWHEGDSYTVALDWQSMVSQKGMNTTVALTMADEIFELLDCRHGL